GPRSARPRRGADPHARRRPLGARRALEQSAGRREAGADGAGGGGRVADRLGRARRGGRRASTRPEPGRPRVRKECGLVESGGRGGAPAPAVRPAASSRGMALATPPRMASRLLLVVNPSSSRAAEGAEQARAVLAEGGLALDEVRCPGESAGLAALVRERAPRLDGVVLGGGDGTLHAALPALLECGVPLGVLPLGTANDFAGAIGLPADPGEAAA